ncbi:hypothetical protein BO86DRAFT_416919 [Aspergillus japonicus CBS 114.51]|uniref:Uncharacterized protein n=1 Tax=Aspergillus japonicus CBS 114.51 TaxID=1448312 RepID=A0A8T8X8P0_ASPJA|nr:hypothetical protein BO86DRAFT_416919 [Aspergillus japonicus CBS 114.51]RAH84385.1 hypothetical protein BO86DRAFT_416919 [Aspergillus japonicus CBS 114.51]
MNMIERINELFEQLSRVKSVPNDYVSLVEERLTLICRPPDRLRRMETARPKREYNLHDRLKRARRIYLEVLEVFPSIFLPFIMTVSPNSCRSWKTSDVRKNLQSCKSAALSGEVLNDLENIAKRVVPLPKPKTNTESDGAWFYSTADVTRARHFLNKDLYEAFENSPRRTREKENQLLTSTQCIRMSFPRYDHQDATVQLDIGFHDSIVKALFPTAWERFLTVHGTELTNVESSQLAREPAIAEIYDNACFTFRGASTSSIPIIFGSSLSQGIEESQLRAWEIKNFVLRTTDCISLDIMRSRPCEATVTLRVGWSHGIFMATKLYAFDG